MMDEQTAEIQSLKADLKRLQAENEKLKPALKEAQENLVALENYTRRENLRFMNIPESRGENCQDVKVGDNWYIEDQSVDILEGEKKFYESLYHSTNINPENFKKTCLFLFQKT